MDHLWNYPSPSGTVGLYAEIRAKSDGDVWNGTANVPYVNADVANYDVALTYLGGNSYGLTVPATLPTGETYIAVVKKPVSLVSGPATTDTKLPDEWEFAWNGTATTAAAPGTASWTYADQTDVSDLLGADGLRIVSNTDTDDSATDTARLQRAGENTDAMLNAWLGGMGFDTPLANMDANTTTVMSMISAELVAAELNKAHMLFSPKNLTSAQIDRIMEGHVKHAKDMMRQIRFGTLKIVADRTFDQTSKIAVIGAVDTTTCGTCWW